MDTVNWARARRQIDEMEEEARGGRIRKDVSGAADAFLLDRDVEGSTSRKYRRILKRLTEFAAGERLETIDRITLSHLDAYKSSRKLNTLSWSKELQLLRTFFAFCGKRKWCEENPAKDMSMPSDPKPKPRAPYTQEEITCILAACRTFGRGAYERRRAYAMILLQRRYGLRVSDVVTLEKDRVKDGRIFVHAMKNGAALWLPLWPDVKDALEILPTPHDAPADCKYFFWTGLGLRESVIKVACRTLQAVFRKSGVKNATSHRFRHTLATEILVNGGTIEDVANILGDSPAIIREHYAKWSVAYQQRTLELLERVHGSPTAHEKPIDVSLFISTVDLVAKVGVEPTRTVKYARF